AQPEAGGRYCLGTELLATAFRFHATLDLRALVHPLLTRVTGELNETTHMAVLDGAEIVYQDKIEAYHSIKLSSVIGGRNPAHATGVGKALLAWSYPTEDALAEWAARWGPLQACTPRTITSVALLAQQLAVVRDRGYALDMEENETGVRCAALPIFLGPGRRGERHRPRGPGGNRQAVGTRVLPAPRRRRMVRGAGTVRTLTRYPHAGMLVGVFRNAIPGYETILRTRAPATPGEPARGAC